MCDTVISKKLKKASVIILILMRHNQAKIIGRSVFLCWHMAILESENKNTDFLMVLP